jgi:hypothetical protein
MKIRNDVYTHFGAIEVCGDTEQSGNGIDLNAANASSDPSIAAVGDDTNVNLVLKGKGTGAAQAGLGAATTSPGGVCGALTDSASNASGTVQNTEYTLNSVTIPANAFNKNGRSVQVEAWGTLAANANAKNLKIYFGARPSPPSPVRRPAAKTTASRSASCGRVRARRAASATSRSIPAWHQP